MRWFFEVLEIKEPHNKAAPGSSPDLLLFPANEMTIRTASSVNKKHLTIKNLKTIHI